jgi:4-hydroxythreonine-4-phosphate dehydrogenase
MGDAAGVGAEVIVKSLAHASVYEQYRPLVIGDARRLERANEIVRGTLRVRRIAEVSEARFEPGTIDCIDLNLIPDDLPFGQLSAVAGDAAYRFIARAVELAQAGSIDAICTAPLNKEALHAGGHKYPGHTEMLAHLTGVEEVSMMLVAPQLRVIHVTTHIGIIDAVRKIEPGLDVTGPLPADTLFFRAGRGDFDLVVAMYHDQGHGPVKVLGLEAGVNITVGLEVIRTSVDHGTAFDIAGTGVVDERSLLEALRQAAELATRRH